MKSPYEGLPPTRFWRTGVAEPSPSHLLGLYARRFSITRDDGIVTAGSCFAQHIASQLRGSGFHVLDYEPEPPDLPSDIARRFGYGIYSARYGNIYAVRQLLQLAEDAFSGRVDEADFWSKDGRVYDALRPAVEPRGFASLAEATAHRRWHLENVCRLFDDMTVFIYTFGLSEAWMHRVTGRVYPTAPGTIAGDYDPALHVFHNFSFQEIYDDFVRFRELVRARNSNVRMLVTVSPVPLTATASEDHVLVANTYSKSVLRAVAGELSQRHADIDYFPSYEIVAGHWSRGRYFEENLRSVTEEGVAIVMRVFSEQHDVGAFGGADCQSARRDAPVAEAENDRRGSRRRRSPEERAERRQRRRAEAEARGSPPEGDGAKSEEDVVCEEILLDAFAR